MCLGQGWPSTYTKPKVCMLGLWMCFRSLVFKFLFLNISFYSLDQRSSKEVIPRAKCSLILLKTQKMTVLIGSAGGLEITLHRPHPIFLGRFGLAWFGLKAFPVSFWVQTIER